MLNNTKDILTLKELQELLHIGKNTALKLVQSGEIEAFMIANKWLIAKVNIEKYLSRL
ncbi:MAG: helix-turn-helix domain-containing protein [Oscillospiraceae bacterium]